MKHLIVFSCVGTIAQVFPRHSHGLFHPGRPVPHLAYTFCGLSDMSLAMSKNPKLQYVTRCTTYVYLFTKQPCPYSRNLIHAEGRALTVPSVQRTKKRPEYELCAHDEL